MSSAHQPVSEDIGYGYTYEYCTSCPAKRWYTTGSKSTDTGWQIKTGNNTAGDAKRNWTPAPECEEEGKRDGLQ